MKPVRVVEDIVRRKAAPPKTSRDSARDKSGPSAVGSNGMNAAFGSAKNYAGMIPKLFGAHAMFFVCSFLVLGEVVIVLNIGTEMIPNLPASQLSDASIGANIAANIALETAMVQGITTSADFVATSSVASSSALLEIKPGLLPIVKIPPPKPTSTPVASVKKTIAPGSQPSKPKPAPTPTVVTARSLIDATTFSLSERYDGPYKIAFVSDAGTYGKIAWDLSKTALTIGGSIPNFAISFSCNPSPTMPAPDAIDQNPTFNIKTFYTCSIGLTPTSGGDRQTQSKQFSFTTGLGQLVVTLPSYINTVLKDEANFGGFVFRNDDTEPVTITGLDVDVSYQGLNVADSPLVLRFMDPATELSLLDYHLENLTVISPASYARAEENIHIPLSFTIGAVNQKMLPIKVLGVRKLGIYGIDPTIVVTLREVATNQNLNRVVLNAAKISWSCIVPLGAYNPNATSGPYITGQACQK